MNRFFSFACVLFALFVSLPARADEASARIHFSKGIDLYDKKNYQGALTEFEAAYKEKPSAGIKQNIALSLKGLNRPADAATAFDEALDEGKDTLKPETKQAIERELTELTKLVATVQVTISGADEKRTAETVVTIQPVGHEARSLAPGAQRRPIRLMPGIYMISAKIPGVPPPEPKKLALISGAPTEVTFGEPLVASTLNLKVNVPEATIKIDGVEVGKGAWQGTVAANKKLRIEVAAQGFKPLAFDMTVPASSTVDSPITLQPVGSSSESKAGGVEQQEKPRGRLYLAITGSLEGAGYRLSQAAGAPTPAGLRQAYAGGSLGGRFGFLVNKYVGLEAFLEAGVAGATLDPVNGGNRVKSQIGHLLLLPGVRFQTPGRVRFTAGTGIGIHYLTLKNEEQITSSGILGSTNVRTGATVEAKGLAFAWLIDAGVQFDLGPLFMEAAAFINVHGVGPVEEDVSSRRALLASPAVRAGLRIGLGIPF